MDLAWVDAPHPGHFFKETGFMLLEALSLGYAVPRTAFEASVHSVFQSAANLRLANGGKLLTLVVSTEADLPQGLRLDTPGDFSFDRLHVGEPVTCRDNLLRLESLSLTVDLRKARLWKCDLPALNIDLTNPAIGSAWSSVWQALNRRQTNSRAAILADDLFRTGAMPQAGVPQKAGQAVRALLQATHRFDLLAASVARELVGLGAGLTPTGDDLLVGYLAGLWCTLRGDRQRLQFVSNLGKIILHPSHQTTDISRTFLEHASQGQVSSLLVDLAQAIRTGADSDRLLNSAETAMQVGHTSGMDTVTGFLLGLAAWDGDHLRRKLAGSPGTRFSSY